MNNFHLSKVSGNSKVGPIAVSMSPKNTCPDSCSLKGKGCYAQLGLVNIHWSRITTGTMGSGWKEFIESVRSLFPHSKFRHNAAGDLPGENEEIDTAKLSELADVVKERKLKAWTYSHKPMKGKNLRAVRSAIKKGFIINASADNIKIADRMRKLNLPTVVIVPTDSPDKFETPAGNRVICCPQQTGKVENCASCMLCQKDRKIIIAFKAHGTMKKRVSEMSLQ